MMENKNHILPALLTLLTAWLLLCTGIAGAIPVKEIIERISIPVAIYMICAFAFSRYGSKGRQALLIILCAFTIMEATIGTLQLLGKYPANNAFFKLNGHFFNQGLYGGFMSLSSLACLHCFIKYKDRRVRAAVAAVFLIAFTMMILSVSRAAWVGFVVATLVMIRRETDLRIDLSRRINVIVVVAAIIAACAAVFVIKPESAIARVHVWRMDCRAIAGHPLTGCGSGAELGAYAEAQSDFFACKERTLKTKMTADSPAFVLNEFLKLGMQGGVPGLLLSIAVYVLALMLLLKKNSEYAYLLIAFGCFSLFSFPLGSTALCSILAILLADASTLERKGLLFWPVAAAVVILCIAPFVRDSAITMRARKEWAGQPDDGRMFGKYYPYLRYDLEYIPLYADKLYYTKHYSRAIKVMTEGIPFSSDANYYCVLGKCHELSGNLVEAEKLYIKAVNMVPSRMTPYYMLTKLYRNLGRIEAARAWKEAALSMPYDPSQTETVRMRKKIEDITFE